MRNEACITELADLKTWYFLNQKQGGPNPYFTLYRGPDQNPSKMIFRNEAENDPDSAWGMMEEVLEMHIPQGGLFRIYITDRAKGNVGLSTLFKVNNPFAQNQQAAGIGSAQFGIHGSIKDLVSSEVSKERKMWELEQMIRDMRAEQDARVGQMDKMLEEFTPVLKDLARAFGMKMMGYGPQPNEPAQASPQPMAGHYTDPAPSADGYDYDRVEPALDELRTVFPDTEGTLEKLAHWARNNPDTALQLFQNLA